MGKTARRKLRLETEKPGGSKPARNGGLDQGIAVEVERSHQILETFSYEAKLNLLTDWM